MLKEVKEIKIPVPVPAPKPYLGRVSSYAFNYASKAYSSASAALKDTYYAIARQLEESCLRKQRLQGYLQRLSFQSQQQNQCLRRLG